MSDTLAPVLERLQAGFDDAVARLTELLRIPSISTDPAYRPQTRAAAEWLADDLAAIGFESKVHDTPGQPIVTATTPGPDHDSDGGDAPPILYYGHYDVQPPDPLDEWDTAPFEPTIVDGPHGKRIIARGAVDDKGQLMTFVEAFRAWFDVHGSLPVKATILLEGEEESGSPSLDPFLSANTDMLAADVAVITDTGMWDIDTPAITSMLRGLVYVEVTLHGPSHDLHSGMYGGVAVNPANELPRILGELRDDRGVIRIPGFYDDVRELTDTQREQWARLGFDEAAFLGHAGLKTPVGEHGRGPLERMWSRPTCDVNGLWGGYTGEGAKTIIPARVSAKISCRLVPDQDPQKVYDGLAAFLHERTPPDCRWEIQTHGLSPAVQVPTDSPFLAAALAGLESVYGRPAVLIGCGGSIPVAGSFQRLLGYDALLVGFGLDDDRIHSPNEKFELRCFEMGMRSQAVMLDKFASVAVSRIC